MCDILLAYDYCDGVQYCERYYVDLVTDSNCHQHQFVEEEVRSVTIMDRTSWLTCVDGSDYAVSSVLVFSTFSPLFSIDTTTSATQTATSSSTGKSSHIQKHKPHH